MNEDDRPGEAPESSAADTPAEVTPSWAPKIVTFTGVAPPVEPEVSEPTTEERPVERQTALRTFVPAEETKTPVEGVKRRSVRGLLAGQDDPTSALTEATLLPFLDEPGTTSTFRVGATGELVLDTSASIPMAVDRDATLGVLPLELATAYHLLALPTDAGADEVEALAVSIWDEAGWQLPGVLYLTQKVTLEGPWEITAETRDSLGLGEEFAAVFLLRAPAVRGEPPDPELLRIDEWAQAFPDGMPLGAEFETLLALRRIGRRLGGQLRLAGSGQIITADPLSAVDLHVFGDELLTVDTVGAALHEQLPGAVKLAGPEPEPGAPYALIVRATEKSTFLVGVSPTAVRPRVLRWESWVDAPLFTYELRWIEADSFVLAGGILSRTGRAERNRVSLKMVQAAATIAGLLPHSAVIDQDDFLLDLDVPPPTPEEQRP